MESTCDRNRNASVSKHRNFFPAGTIAKQLSVFSVPSAVAQDTSKARIGTGPTPRTCHTAPGATRAPVPWEVATFETGVGQYEVSQTTTGDAYNVKVHGSGGTEEGTITYPILVPKNAGKQHF